MAAVCLQLGNPLTANLVISTVFIPTLRYALVAIFLLSNLNITIVNPSSSPDRMKTHPQTAIFPPSRLPSDAPHSLADVARYRLAVLFSVIFSVYPALNPAHSNQSRNDSQVPRVPNFRGLDRSKRRHVAKASVHWRASRTLSPKTPKTSNYTRSDEYGHAADNPQLRYPIKNPPCCQPSHERSNDASQTLATAIDRQTDVLHRVLSAVRTSPQTPTEPARSYSAVADTPHSFADLARYWLADLVSALSPALYPATHSNQSRDDFLPSRDLSHTLNRSIISRRRHPTTASVLDLSSKRHRHLTKVSVHRRRPRRHPMNMVMQPTTPPPATSTIPAVTHLTIDPTTSLMSSLPPLTDKPMFYTKFYPHLQLRRLRRCRLNRLCFPYPP
jgi:hypothetical protein